nr:hypothetical protein CFP56_03420 [Quercus suber]
MQGYLNSNFPAGSRITLPSFWPDIMQNVAFPWASDIGPVYLVTHKKQLRLKCSVACMGSNHQVEEDITNILEQHPNWKSVGMGGNHRGNLYVLFLPPLLAEAK